MGFLEGQGDQPVWDAILTYTNGRTKRGSTFQQVNIDCPMCLARGEKTIDRRGRCGIKREASYILVNCFNCRFKSRFEQYREMSRSFQALLLNLGMPDNEVKKLRMWSIRVRDLQRIGNEEPVYHGPPQFTDAALPEGSQSLQQWDAEGCTEQDYLDVVSYLLARGEVATLATTYYWSPAAKERRRLIIPCIHHGRTVGWIGRAVDADNKRKYYNQTPGNFLFNADVLTHRERKYAFVVEGIFDALAIDGVAVMGAGLSEVQARWIKQSGKQPVVVPDLDEAGKKLVRHAIKHGWHVALPHLRFAGRKWWGDKIKDVDEAAKKCGKLFVLQSIVSTMTNDRVKLEQYLRI